MSCDGWFFNVLLLELVGYSVKEFFGYHSFLKYSNATFITLIPKTIFFISLSLFSIPLPARASITRGSRSFSTRP